MNEIEFYVKRVTEDKENVFVIGEVYLAQITEMDFIWEDRDSMNVWLANEKVDIEGLWAVSDFEKEFLICSKVKVDNKT